VAPPPERVQFDAIVVGGGHNGLVAATLLARAGRSVLVLERHEHIGGAAVSTAVFPCVGARLSRYAYLVSLFPRALLEQLGLAVELRRRRVASYTPSGKSGVLVRNGIAPGENPLSSMIAKVAPRIFTSLTEPLRSREELRRVVGDEEAWDALFERPLSELLEAVVPDDLERGVALTDATVGTFAPADDPELRQNRSFIYHVIGNGTGRWDVPLGGMGALTDALARAAADAGAVIRTRAEVEAVETDGVAAEVRCSDGSSYGCSDVLSAVAPAVLTRLLGEEVVGPRPEGSQLKINMVVSRLPRLLDQAVSVEDAFTGTFHVNEGYAQLGRAYEEAAQGQIPTVPPCELYCHSLTDPSVLSPDPRAAGVQTLTLFGLHMPARLFADDPAGAKERAVAATMRSVDSVLAEPLEDCLIHDRDGRPSLEAHTPPELEAELGMPAGHIFHRDLSWPFAESDQEVGRWGVETEHPNVWLCGAGARRGGCVSGIPGHNAARAVLGGR
jgi:phytoene dehydrogenase-like protein